MFRYHLLLISLIAIGNLNNVATAQDTLVNVDFHGRLDSLHSAILNQERLFQVFLPPAYKPGSGVKYDVLYVPPKVGSPLS